MNTDLEYDIDPKSMDHGPLGRIVAALNALGSCWIIALMLLIVADISLRTFANAPIAGTPEMVSFSIVGIVFLQLSHTLRSGNLTRTDILLYILRAQAPRLHRLILAIFNLTSAVLMGIALWLFLPSLQSAWEHPERHFVGSPGFFTMPQWPLYALMALGIAVTILQFAALAWTGQRGRSA